MDTSRKHIELTVDLRGGNKGSSFAGRNEGKSARESLGLDELDHDKSQYRITIPTDTTSFNPSFYLGLFFPSIETLKWEKFKEKYQFDFTEMEHELSVQIEKNISECERKAINELSGRTGLD